ncbi:heterokaryon incompatibility protein-domain-containing protein, partial [Pyrenochaeta sp. MPI-SDFR-AT-0127]
MARNWVRDCNQNHEACCPRRTQEETPLPSRVVDVGDGLDQPPRILESNGRSGAFAALSYCWGSHPSLRTTQMSLKSHLSQLPLQNLSATVRQAIEVTRGLGLRYIWIDALCIVQDDPDDWAREAAQMLQVYSNASVTISASTSSEASEGLFRSRDESNNFLLLSPVRLSLHVPRDLPVDKRGWILQEQEMSTRLLHFGKGVLHWACLTSSGSEADPQGMSYDHAAFNKPRRERRYTIQRQDRLGDAKYKLCEYWEELVAEYSKRKLSYASDRIPAILGLAKMMAPALGSGEPIAGIWRGGEFSVRSLAWAAQTLGFANPCYPSWSWAS